MRISCEATATNALTFPSRSVSRPGERVQVRVRETAERDGQHVELAGLDERQQERQRPVELGDLDLGGGLGPATVAEADGAGRRRGGGASAPSRGRPAR